MLSMSYFLIYGVFASLSTVLLEKIITIIIGILLGARIGALTVIATLAEGPLIAFFTKKVQAFYFRKIRKV